MKKRALSMLVVGLFALGIGNSSLACDQTFHGTLRHGVGYLFDDTFHGTKSTSYYLWNWNVDYNEQYDYNNSSSFPEFDWTDAIVNQDYEVRPNQSIKTLETKTPYNIYSVPAKRAYNNLLVKYTITYSDNEAGNNTRNHVECKYYEISWCGDGILDTGYGEQCDPNDPNQSGWGNGGCNASCKSITNPEPVCNTAYHNTTTYNANFPTPRIRQSDALCTVGSAAGSLSFNSATGKYSWSCTGGAGTTPKSCQAQDLRCGDGAKNGSEQCDPNDPNKSGWGNGGCDTSCKPINNPEPVCSSTYNGQTLESLADGAHLCTRGNPSGFSFANNRWTWSCNGAAGTTPAQCAATKKEAPQPPVCSSTYNGKTLENLTNGAHLCSKGSPSGFAFANNTWTWKCNGAAGTTPVDCSANKKETPIYDLALTKTITNKKPSYKVGDELEFTFTVYNQGNKEARNIQITDYFPSDLELVDTTWTLVAGKATKTLTETILPGANKSLTMRVKINAAFKGTKIVNKAEISKDNSGDYNTVDKDSTPNSNPSDDCYSGDDKHIITGNGKTATAGNCTDTTDEDDHDGVSIAIDARPEIKKNLTGDPNHHYKIGELVGFKMPFKNTTANTLLKVSIKDFLPLNLEYVSSEIHGVSPVLSGLSLRQGVTVLEYSGFNLSPNQEGYLLFTGRVKADHLTERINTVGIYVNDLLVESDTETYKVIHPNLMIEKLVDKKVVNSGDVVTFTLNIRALSGVFDELKVIDTLPKGLVYVENTQKLTNSTTNTTITDFSVVKNTSNLDTLNWKLAFADKIKAGQSFQLQFQARLVEASNGKYTNTACVEDPKTSHDPICDTEDVTPRDPKGDLSIKKYVNKVSADAGREDILMEGFTKGQTAFFTLEVRDAKQAITGFVVEDVVEGNLEYLDSSDLLNNAFTGLYLRAGANTDPYSYQTTLKTEKIAGNKTRLQWKVEMTQGNFLPGDVYKIQFKAKVNGDQKNIGTVEYSTPNTPNGKSEDDASVKTNEVGLTIKKYVSDRIDGNWQDDSLQLSNGATAYFKLVIGGATNSLTGFKITDKVENNLKYLDSTDLANNAFTGVITFGVNNPGKPAYTITPKATGTHPTDLEWQIDMGGAFFMPGDELVIIFKAQKNGDQTNIAHVYYPKRDGTTGHAQDPARVTNPSGGGGGGRGGGWYSPSCGNGRKDGNEICDLGSTQTVGSDGKLFTSSYEYNKAYAGYTCTSTCRLEKEGTKLVPQCFNVQNGSISIMKGEMLPFYWNMEAQGGTGTQQQKTDWLRRHFVFACGDTNDLGKISLSSMQCSFKVYGPGKQNSNEIYSFTAPCALSLNAWLDANNNLYPALKSYIAQNKKGWFGGSELNEEGLVKNVFDSLDNREYPTLLPLSSKLLITNFGTPSAVLHKSSSTLTRHSSDITTFGEYKVALERVEYQICNGKDEKGKQIAPKDSSTDERICEVDFAVTDPYLIQKSPYGIGNKATTDLRKYQLKNGTSFMDEYFKTEIKDPKDYQAPENMQKLFTTFKNKYQRIAKPLGNGLSKVPGKSIYFYDGNDDITSVLGKDVIAKPFTLIASKEEQDLKIKGSLYTNAMIMTAGKIHIDASASCNGNKTKYGRAGQVLQGIFYAGKGFKSIGHENLKNTDANLHKGEWCNYGNLHIKGVAIGDLSEVVNHRRSELYEWFSADASKGSEKKKEIVVNGASVLVDYNPSLRGQLPPGAEEFNKALEVYRK